jgi:hypothetical protein
MNDIESDWVSGFCGGKKCSLCGQPASARVVEHIFYDDPFGSRIPLFAYLCVPHFRRLMGDAGVNRVENYRNHVLASNSAGGSSEGVAS